MIQSLNNGTMFPRVLERGTNMYSSQDKRKIYRSNWPTNIGGGQFNTFIELRINK